MEGYGIETILSDMEEAETPLELEEAFTKHFIVSYERNTYEEEIVYEFEVYGDPERADSVEETRPLSVRLEASYNPWTREIEDVKYKLPETETDISVDPEI